MADTTIANKQTKTNKETLQPILERFYHWEQTIPNKVYLRQPQNGQWTEYTWAETANQVRRMASALEAMNLPPKSRVGIVSKNCAHWIMSDLAIMMAGHISTPFYPTLTDEKLNQVLVHSETKVLFVGKLDDWEGMREGVPQDVHCIAYPDSPSEKEGYDKWDDLIAKHEPMAGNPMPDLQDLATIIYTSGTTGMPKGVMHTHYTLAYPLKMAAPILNVGENSDKYFSYLPLCHIAERAIVESASLYSGGSVSFVESLDTFAANLAEVQPTHFLAVPRIWTKFQLGVLAKMPQSKLDMFLKIPILSGMVKKKIKKTLGLSNTKTIITGAAPMPRTLLEWYQKLGIVIQEAYGMTENGGCCTYMRKDKIKMGTVGQPYPEAEVKIDPKNGEVLMRGEWVMKGYYKEPEKTAETIKDGWLHTGDMGEIDSEGFLKITGRVKDQFKTAKGEFVVPGPIEAGFATNSNIEQICVVGRGLAQPVALIVLSELGQAANKESLLASLNSTLKKVNEKALKHEIIKKVIITKEAWSVENNLLTPTLKVKRNVLEEVYGEKLEAWYESKDTIIWE